MTLDCLGFHSRTVTKISGFLYKLLDLLPSFLCLQDGGLLEL